MKKAKRKTWLWVIGWIFIFPLPFTIIFSKKKYSSVKYVAIALAWVLYIVIGIAGSTTIEHSESTTPEATETTQTEAEVHLYDKAEVRDVLNGTRNAKIGEYVVIFADSSECTEEALADLYFNYFSDQNFNYLVIIYSDKDGTSGVYVNTGIIGVNDNFQKDEYGDYMLIDSPEEILYSPNKTDKTLIKY